MDDILTLERVIEETNAYFDSGRGNPALRESIIQHMLTKKEVPRAVLASLGLERITAWKRKHRRDGEKYGWKIDK